MYPHKCKHALQVFPCLIILIFVAAGCQQNTPRPALSAKEVGTLATQLTNLTNLHLQAWANRDEDLLRQIYTEDFVHHDLGQDLVKGNDSVISFMKDFRNAVPDYQNRLGNVFIGQNDGVYSEDTWGWVPMDFVKNVFSSDHPMRHYMWMTIRDGKFSYWWLFYGEEVFSAGNLPFDEKLMRDYADAWSSGDVEKVANLYTPEATRLDTLFSEDQQGTTAIKEYATNFFTWYPGVNLSLLESFGEFTRVIKRGGEYSIHVSDLNGNPCDVKMVVVLEPDETQAKIAHEWVFYNADSLIACGWAQ